MTAEVSSTRRRWYDIMINTLAAIVLFLVWQAFAWAASKWIPPYASQEHWFLIIVAMSYALHAHKVKP